MHLNKEVRHGRPISGSENGSKLTEVRRHIRLGKILVDAAFDAIRIADRAADLIESADSKDRGKLSVIANRYYEGGIGGLGRAIHSFGQAAEHPLPPRLQAYVAAKTAYCRLRMEACLRLCFPEYVDVGERGSGI